VDTVVESHRLRSRAENLPRVHARLDSTRATGLLVNACVQLWSGGAANDRVTRARRTML
jgi:hypothetical protein